MNLTTATPAEIDTRYIELEMRYASIVAQADHALKIANGHDRYRRDEDSRLQAAAEFKKLQKQSHPIAHEINEINGEWKRRGCIAAGIDGWTYDSSPAAYPGWSRVYVVPGGHCHRSQRCHSLYADTVTVLVPRDIRKRDLSGATEEEIVAAVGERACTHCYPSAPVDKPSTIVLPDEDAKMQARAEREAKRQAAAEKKAAKAITHPDGSRIKHDIWYVDTESEARRLYVGAHADAAWGAYTADVEFHARRTAEVEPLLIAIAHKHGRDVEELRKELEPKIAAKAKRDKRESEKHARTLGLI